MRVPQQPWRVVGLVLLSGMLLAACADCRCREAPVEPPGANVDAAPPPEPPRPRLDVKFLSRVMLPLRGGIAAITVADDEGVVVADASDEGVILRRFDPAFHQMWEYALPTVRDLHVRDMIADRDTLWVAATFAQPMTLEGSKLAVVRDADDYTSANLLILRCDASTGQVRSVRQLGGYVDVDNAFLAHEDNGLIVVASFRSIGTGAYSQWGRSARDAGVRGQSMIVTRLEDETLAEVWATFADPWYTPPQMVVATDRHSVIISSVSDRHITVGGTRISLSQQESDWHARLDFETGAVVEVVELPRTGASFGAAGMLREGRAYYLMGGQHAVIDVWSPALHGFRMVESGCAGPCGAAAIWGTKEGAVVVFRSELPATALHVGLISAEGRTMDHVMVPNMDNAIVVQASKPFRGKIYIHYAGDDRLDVLTADVEVR